MNASKISGSVARDSPSHAKGIDGSLPAKGIVSTTDTATVLGGSKVTSKDTDRQELRLCDLGWRYSIVASVFFIVLVLLVGLDPGVIAVSMNMTRIGAGSNQQPKGHDPSTYNLNASTESNYRTDVRGKFVGRYALVRSTLDYAYH